jgi:hypothetical protein
MPRDNDPRAAKAPTAFQRWVLLASFALSAGVWLNDQYSEARGRRNGSRDRLEKIALAERCAMHPGVALGQSMPPKWRPRECPGGLH